MKHIKRISDIQDLLPNYWTRASYPAHFNRLPLPHRHFNHTLAHAMKALGGLAALSDSMDHFREDKEALEYHTNASKWLADLVICAARMADEVGLDIEKCTEDRVNTLIERWGEK